MRNYKWSIYYDIFSVTSRIPQWNFIISKDKKKIVHSCNRHCTKMFWQHLFPVRNVCTSYPVTMNSLPKRPTIGRNAICSESCSYTNQIWEIGILACFKSFHSNAFCFKNFCHQYHFGIMAVFRNCERQANKLYYYRYDVKIF